MSIDTAAILAARYHNNPAPLKAAVLGQGDVNINPYAALRALQLQKDAERYEMAQAAMRGQQMQNQPSMVEQALSPTPPQMPPQMQQPQMPQQMQQPQGLSAMQQAQPQQPSPGLEGMPVPEGEYAGGGIVAFAGEDGSYVDSGDQLTPEMLADLQDKDQVSSGDPASYQSIAARLPGLLENIEKSEYKAFTPEQYKEAFTKRRALIEEGAGPDPYAPMGEQIAGLEGERAQNLGQAKGMALLAAAGDVMQPGGLLRGLGAAGKTFAGMYGQALAADKAEKRALMSMRFNLADAQRKERMGLNREAIAAADQARVDNTAAQRFGLEKNKAMAMVASNMARATKPTGTGGDKTPKGYDNLVSGLYGELKYKNEQLKKNNPNDPNIKSDEVLLADAHRAAAPLWAKLPAGEVMDVKREDVAVEKKRAEDLAKDAEERRKQEEERIKIEKARLEKERAELDERRRSAEQREATDKQRIATEQGTKINEALAKWERSREAIEAKRDGTYDEKRKAKIKALREQYPDANVIRTSPQSDAAPTSGPGNKNSPPQAASGKVITRADIKATAKASNKTEAEVEAAAKKAGYTIK